MLDVALLGCGGMMPIPGRFLTSLLLRLNGRFLMIDCGECTQVTLKMLGWGVKNIDCICITHVHADHISGLPGLLLTIGNSGRVEPLKMIGPKGLREVVKSLCVIAPELPFDVEIIEITDDTKDIKINDFKVNVLKGNHNILCYGYKIEVPRKGKFDVKKAKTLNIPVNYWSLLQNEETITHDGQNYTPDMVMGEERPGIKIGYMTDTRPLETMIEFFKDSDLFIGEGIYGDDEKIHKAKEYHHSTFSETATIAKNANVKKLWLTHYSPSLTEPEEYLHVAQEIFQNTELGFDGKTAIIPFPEI